MTNWISTSIACLTLFFGILTTSAHTAPNDKHGLMKSETERPLRYQPDGTDFVIQGGSLLFNRPLYGRPTGFRVDAGDRPEFVFYLPGRGGNLRLGIKTNDGLKWLHNASNITARYRPGAMIYIIQDPLLGKNARLHLTAQSLYDTEGLILRVRLEASRSVQLITAYGGVNGERGPRDGAINTGDEPISQFFQLKPEYTRNNSFDLQGHRFTLESKPATVVGTFPGASFALANARQWGAIRSLLNSTGSPDNRPVVVGQMPLKPGQEEYLALQRTGKGGVKGRLDLPEPYDAEQLPDVFNRSEHRRAEIASKLTVNTPDPYINSAVAALNHAAHGIWDERTSSVVHGAVAWRNTYPGWRGAYAFDALGWHEKTRSHLNFWGERQRTNDRYPTLGQPEEEVYRARSEPSLHSNGHIRTSHYDMNLIYIDTLLRHLLWTGDMGYAEKMWPVIERSMDWEKRLFRRTFAPELENNDLPLYEAYAAIWASDRVLYNGGGVAHASAYNYYHNKMVARLAQRLGKDPTPYREEARAIREAMKSLLWLPHRGYMAEAKDILADEALYPAPALWTYYHTIDSEVVDPLTGYQMGRYVDTKIPHIPIHGPGVPEGNFSVMAHSSWMPWEYSTNDVTMAEDMHTALADWQIGRYRHAFRVFKGHLLDSMFMGMCPGGLHMLSQFDVYRNEVYRDFADPIGITGRALVEGLFGIVPDALNNELLIRPGFPEDWEHARIDHDKIAYRYQREDDTERYSINPRFDQSMKLRLKIRARATRVRKVTVNGQPAEWKRVQQAITDPAIEITADSADQFNVVIHWEGPAPAQVKAPEVVATEHPLKASFGDARLLSVHDPQQIIDSPENSSHSFTANITAGPGHHTVFARIAQGDMRWWAPVNVRIRPPVQIVADPEQTSDRIRFRVRNNTNQKLTRNATLSAGDVSESVRLSVRAHGGTSQHITLPASGMLPGTIPITLKLSDNRSVRGSVTNWKIPAPDVEWHTIDLTGTFNDRVDQIFEHGKYLSPRSPYTSLSTPTQGIGGWAGGYNTLPEIDDSGLRREAAENNGKIHLPNGVPLRTPTGKDTRNIAFTSQWDNYPERITVPLDGRARHVYMLMAGSTNPMKSRTDNGRVIVTYQDGTRKTLELRNPTTWWPIERDYLIDDYAFRRDGAIPPRVNLKTGKTRIHDRQQFKGKGGPVEGGAATVLDLPVNPDKTLRSVTVRTDVHEPVIGLMSVTLARETN